MCSIPSTKRGSGQLIRPFLENGGVKVKKEEPKQVAPAQEKEPEKTPVVAPTDVGSGQDETAEANNKQRKKRGYAATRVAEDRAVLTDAAPVSGGRQTLG